jgi:hypothetical protein
LITQGGLVFTDGRVAPLAEDTPFEWMSHFRKGGSIKAPEQDRDELLAALLTAPNLPALEVPEELRYEEVTPRPRPGLRVRAPEPAQRGTGRLRAELSFDYDGRIVRQLEAARGFYDAEARRLLRRDSQAEKAASALLIELGVKFQTYAYGAMEPFWDIAPTKLPRIVRTLVEAGWHIEADGKVFRRPGAFHMEVSSGVDWFDLHGQVD